MREDWASREWQDLKYATITLTTFRGALLSNDLGHVVLALGRTEPGGVGLLGTGFAVSPTKIATAYHVIGADDKNINLVMPRTRRLADYQDTSDQRVNFSPLTVSAVDPIRDLCVLSLTEDSRLSFAYSISSSDACPPGSTVTTLGFPHANVGRMVLTQQTTQVGARVLIEHAGTKSKHIVLNIQAREGQSGGPVFTSDGRSVAAVLIGSYAPGGGGQISLGGVDPATLHQTTHAISAEYLLAMI